MKLHPDGAKIIVNILFLSAEERSWLNTVGGGGCFASLFRLKGMCVQHLSDKQYQPSVLIWGLTKKNVVELDLNQ